MAVFKKLKKSKEKHCDSPLPGVEPVRQIDKRMGLDSYRDFFTLKNYWKAVDRKKVDAANIFLQRYLKQNPENVSKYPKLKNINVESINSVTNEPGFEMLASAYLKVFDDVITAVEEKTADVSDACNRLVSVGKMHRTKVSEMDGSDFQGMEEPFLHMISEILQDRYNEKAENLFRKFYQFCLKYLLEGFNS